MLQVINVDTYYGNVHALQGVSLKVPAGVIITLVGANGAGKTTLLRTILGIVRAASGEIYFQGTRIERAHPHEIVKIKGNIGKLSL